MARGSLAVPLDATDPPSALRCLEPCPAEAMKGYTDAPLVSSVRNDGPELVGPLNPA